MTEIIENNVLSAFYGKKAFLKVKQCLEIGKIQFAFVNMEDSRIHIDCYMDAEEFAVFLMNNVKNGRLFKAIQSEKAKGDEYPKAVWTSTVGGNETGNNGSPISRYFTISPGAKTDILITAMSFPADRSETGAFIKRKGASALAVLRVPISFNDLLLLEYKWSFLEKDYMTRKYCIENMTNTYIEDEESSYKDDDTPLRDETVKLKETEQSKVSVYKLTANTELTKVPDKNIKICKVDLDGSEKRLIVLTDKFEDLKRLAQFESQLKTRISDHKTLSFKGEVCEKGNDLYLTKFA